MKRILIKIAITIGLSIAIFSGLEMDKKEAVLLTVLMFPLVSWIAFLFEIIDSYSVIFRAVAALVGTGLILGGISELWTLILPDTTLRLILQGISFLAVSAVPIIRDLRYEQI